MDLWELEFFKNLLSCVLQREKRVFCKKVAKILQKIFLPAMGCNCLSKPHLWELEFFKNLLNCLLQVFCDFRVLHVQYFYIVRVGHSHLRLSVMDYQEKFPLKRLSCIFHKKYSVSKRIDIRYRWAYLLLKPSLEHQHFVGLGRLLFKTRLLCIKFCDFPSNNIITNRQRETLRLRAHTHFSLAAMLFCLSGDMYFLLGFLL